MYTLLERSECDVTVCADAFPLLQDTQHHAPHADSGVYHKMAERDDSMQHHLHVRNIGTCSSPSTALPPQPWVCLAHHSHLFHMA